LVIELLINPTSGPDLLFSLPPILHPLPRFAHLIVPYLPAGAPQSSHGSGKEAEYDRFQKTHGCILRKPGCRTGKNREMEPYTCSDYCISRIPRGGAAGRAFFDDTVGGSRHTPFRGNGKLDQVPVPDPEEPPPPVPRQKPELPENIGCDWDGPQPEDRVAVGPLNVRTRAMQAPGHLHADERHPLFVHDRKMRRCFPSRLKEIHGSPQRCKGQRCFESFC
jgi:hypothetical protein